MRLRRDLHNGLGPQLATLTVKIEAAQNLMESDPQAALLLLAEVKAESQQAIREIRRVVNGLRPPALDQFGLVSALQEFVAQRDATSATKIRFDGADDLPSLPAAVEVAAYRITIEAVSNVVRHAEARNCTIRMWNGECGMRNREHPRISQSAIANQLCIEVNDDGSGLPPDYHSGVGLVSMRERALELGGTFEIESEAGQGTAVHVFLPLPDEWENE